jgi:hypothetical protein
MTTGERGERDEEHCLTPHVKVFPDPSLSYARLPEVKNKI